MLAFLLPRRPYEALRCWPESCTSRCGASKRGWGPLLPLLSEKLWIHGGAVLDFAENVSRGHDHWREPYIAQGAHKRAQIEQMIRYAESNQCRMASLVRHFGDLTDAEEACGICDYCAPASCAAQRFRTATEAERRRALFEVVAALRSGGPSRPANCTLRFIPTGH
jgi:hypothetical protein